MLRARLIYEIKYKIINSQKNDHNLCDKMNKADGNDGKTICK